MNNLTNEQLKELLKETETRQKALAGIFRRKPQQIYAAIHTDQQPTLRKKISAYLINKKKTLELKRVA